MAVYDLVARLRLHAESGAWDDRYSSAARGKEAAEEIENLRGVLQGIIDLGGTMGLALYAETVDRAARRALAKPTQKKGK